MINILVVDDQTSVLDGILSSVHFADLGFSAVYTATNVEDAIAIFREKEVDVLVSDIEMPGRSGLELVSFVKENYPNTISILLTSHADFTYAQECIRLGCFDYLVQPAPFTVIESSLRRALTKRANDMKRKELGSLYQANKTVFLNTVSQKLLYRNQKDVEDALTDLNAAGYSIDLKTETQLIIVDTLEFSEYRSDAPSQSELRAAIEFSIQSAALPCEPESMLLLVDRHRRFAVLFFESELRKLPLDNSELDAFYNQLSINLSRFHTACYVCGPFPLGELRARYSGAVRFICENIHHENGVFQISDSGQLEAVPTSLPIYIDRWTNMLHANMCDILMKDIFSYIDSKFSEYSNKYQRLCELHQQLTQMFFRYFFDNRIEIISLFTDDYPYSKYLEAYNSIESLKTAVSFMIDALHSQSTDIPDLDYVEKAQSYILQNLDRNVTVREIAGKIGLNPEYFTRIFKKNTGINLKDYIIECKITAAKDLLRNSSLSVSMIALELGYSNFSHFTQIFKKLTGLTPSEYRKNDTNTPNL